MREDAILDLLLTSDKFDLSIRNKNGLNALHLAVVAGNHKYTIEIICRHYSLS